jgi:hypothetical protein
MTRAFILFAIAGCARAAEHGPDAGGGPPVIDAPVAAADASRRPVDAESHDAAPSPDAAAAFTPIPPSDLTTLQAQGSCTEVYKGWTR